jgi:antirestriction protein
MEGSLVKFQSEQDAQKVSEQLPEATVIGNQVYCSDKRALELAIAITEISGYQWQPRGIAYPEAEFEYNGDNPRIYVRCLAAYNSGYLHGLWIDAAQHLNDIQNDINWMLSWSPVGHIEVCEEWAIHDYEGFGSFQLSEYESLEVVSAIASAIAQYGEVFAAYVSCEYPSIQEIEGWDEVIEKFQSAYAGHFESEKDFALKSSEIDEMFDFAAFQKQFPFWANHIDWESVAVDLFCGEYYSVRATDKGWGIYVFRNC